MDNLMREEILKTINGTRTQEEWDALKGKLPPRGGDCSMAVPGACMNCDHDCMCRHELMIRGR